MQLNFEGLEIQKWNIPTDRAQRVDKKMGLFVWLSCLLPSLRSLKCPKCLFCIFADASRRLVTFWPKYLSPSERSYLASSENAMDCWILTHY